MKLETKFVTFEADSIQDIENLIALYEKKFKSDNSVGNSEEDTLAQEYFEATGTRFRMQSKFTGNTRMEQLLDWKSKFEANGGGKPAFENVG